MDIMNANKLTKPKKTKTVKLSQSHLTKINDKIIHRKDIKTKNPADIFMNYPNNKKKKV